MGHHIDAHSRKTLQKSLGEVLGTGFKQKKETLNKPLQICTEF